LAELISKQVVIKRGLVTTKRDTMNPDRFTIIPSVK